MFCPEIAGRKGEKTMIWNRERYIAHCLFEYTGREMFVEMFGPLVQLEAEWRKAGVPEEEIGMSAFDWDYVPHFDAAAVTGAVTGITPRVLKDNAEETVAIDHMGRHTRVIKRTASIPLPMDFPVKEPEELEKVKKWYAFSEDRIDTEKLYEQRKQWERGELSVFQIPGVFDELRDLMGEQLLCVSFLEEPDLIRDLLDTFTDTAVKCIERAGAIVPIDCLHLEEDLAGKNGPFIGPNIIREFFYPYYSRVYEAARAYGAKLFSMDSDGDVSPIIPALIDCGLNCLYPCEPVGGMDIAALRKQYGKKLCLAGGISKFSLFGGPEKIRAELERRITPDTLGGGTVFGLDHRIPNGISIENYRYYVRLGREMLGLPPVSGTGWGRMAF